MATFFLIHGAWQGAWVWEKLVLNLKNAGHKVITPDLPGNGYNKSIPIEKVTLNVYRDHILNLLEDISEKVILVGHSMSGAVISLVAEANPEKIKKLVFLTAFLMEDGQSMTELIEQITEQHLLLNFSSDYSTATLQEDCIISALFSECEKFEAENAKKHIINPQAMGVFQTKLKLTKERFGSVSRVYIECTKDVDIPIYLQRKMIKSLPCEQVFTIDTEHSPFLSRPNQLSDILLEIAK